MCLFKHVFGNYSWCSLDTTKHNRNWLKKLSYCMRSPRQPLKLCRSRLYLGHYCTIRGETMEYVSLPFPPSPFSSLHSPSLLILPILLPPHSLPSLSAFYPPVFYSFSRFIYKSYKKWPRDSLDPTREGTQPGFSAQRQSMNVGMNQAQGPLVGIMLCNCNDC